MKTSIKETMFSNGAETQTTLFVMPQDEIKFCAYGCCGNCRYYDGDGWCGLHRCSTTGGDTCDSWE